MPIPSTRYGCIGCAVVGGEDRALGVGTDDPHLGLPLLEVAADPGDRAAGADRHDDRVDLAPGLLPELGRRCPVVRLGVRVVRVLVGLEAARDLLGEPVGDGVVALGRVVLDGRRRDHHLGAVGPERRDLLLTHLVRHHEDAAVTLVCGRDREPDAGVAGGRLDDRPARPEAPVVLGGLDHRDADAVLVRAAGVEELELREQRRARLPAERDEPDDRRGRRRGRGRSGTRAPCRAEPSRGRRPAASCDAARADDAPCARRERLDLDASARLRRVDHAPVADVEADVAEPPEEDEVAGPQVPAADRAADAVERGRVVRQLDAEPAVDPGDESGAVESRRRAPPYRYGTPSCFRAIRTRAARASDAARAGRMKCTGLCIGRDRSRSASRRGSRAHNEERRADHAHER